MRLLKIVLACLFFCSLTGVPLSGLAAAPGDTPDWASRWYDRVAKRLEDMKPPAGVTPGTWDDFRSAFLTGWRDQLVDYPGGDCYQLESTSAVNLRMYDDGTGNYWLAWDYHNPCDFDRDTGVGLFDLLMLAEAWQQAGPTADLREDLRPCDLDGSGQIDAADLALFTAAFGCEITSYTVIEDIPGSFAARTVGSVDAYNRECSRLQSTMFYKVRKEYSGCTFSVIPTVIQPAQAMAGVSAVLPRIDFTPSQRLLSASGATTLSAEIWMDPGRECPGVVWSVNTRDVPGAQARLARGNRYLFEHGFVAESNHSVLAGVSVIGEPPERTARAGITVASDYVLSELDPAIDHQQLMVLPVPDGHLLAYVAPVPDSADQEVRVIRIPGDGSIPATYSVACTGIAGKVGVSGFALVDGVPTLLVSVNPTPEENATDGSTANSAARLLVVATDETGRTWREGVPTPSELAARLVDLDGAPAVIWCEPDPVMAPFGSGTIQMSSYDYATRSWSPPVAIVPGNDDSSSYVIDFLCNHNGPPVLAVSQYATQHNSWSFYIPQAEATDPWKCIGVETKSGPSYLREISSVLLLEGRPAYALLMSPYAGFDSQRTYWKNGGGENARQLLPCAENHDRYNTGSLLAELDAKYSFPAALILDTGGDRLPAVVQVVQSADLGTSLKLTARPPGKGWSIPTYWRLSDRKEGARICSVRPGGVDHPQDGSICWVEVVVEVTRPEGARHLLVTKLPVIVD